MVKENKIMKHLFLRNYELASKTCHYDIDKGTFTELSSNQVEDSMVSRGFYALLNGTFVALFATEGGPGFLVNSSRYLLKKDSFQVTFCSGEEKNSLEITIQNRKILSVSYDKSEYLDFDNWSTEEDVDFGAWLFDRHQNEQFITWYTLA